MLVLVFLFLFSGARLAVYSVPMILGRIPPNGFYGFRMKKTMENPDNWYPMNAYRGKWLLGAGLVLVLAAVCLYFVPGISIDVYAYTVLAAWSVMFAIAMVASFRYMNYL
jgi:hypothetical protein